VDKNKIK